MFCLEPRDWPWKQCGWPWKQYCWPWTTWLTLKAMWLTFNHVVDLETNVWPYMVMTSNQMVRPGDRQSLRWRHKEISVWWRFRLPSPLRHSVPWRLSTSTEQIGEGGRGDGTSITRLFIYDVIEATAGHLVEPCGSRSLPYMVNRTVQGQPLIQVDPYYFLGFAQSL
jgi:hypothetical protein